MYIAVSNNPSLPTFAVNVSNNTGDGGVPVNRSYIRFACVRLSACACWIPEANVTAATANAAAFFHVEHAAVRRVGSFVLFIA
jgi:hypothetical protein